MQSIRRGIRQRDRRKIIESSPFVLTRLRKDGKPSGMHDAKSYFRSEDDAIKYVASVRDLNPTIKLRYDLNGTEI